MVRSSPLHRDRCVSGILCGASLLLCFGAAAVAGPEAAGAQDVRGSTSKKREVTLQSVFGVGELLSGEPSPVTWSPDGAQLIYIQQGDNGSELWTIDVSTGSRKLLVDSKNLSEITAPISHIDDAVERERRTRYGVTSYHWAPDAKHIQFDANGALHYYNLGTGQSKKVVTAGPAIDPKFSPDGQRVSYVVHHNLFVHSLADGREHPITLSTGPESADGNGDVLNGEVDWLYEEELGVRSNYFWSPDSKQVAFLQSDLRRVPSHPITDYIPTHATMNLERYPLVGDPLPVVRLGVVSRKGGKIHWINLDAADSYLPRFGWVNSRTLFAIVLDRKQKTAKLLFIDERSGKSRCVLSETSDAFIDVESHLQFRSLQSGNQFLWMSWRDGFTHVYLYSFDPAHPLASEAKLERQLTRGNFEVAAISGISEKTGTLFYVANKEDDRQQDLYAVGFDGSNTRRLTTDEGYNSISFNPQETAYVKVHSRADRASERSICTVDGECRVVDAPSTIADFYDIRPPQFIDFTADDGTVLHGMLFLPPHVSGKVPLILAPYGGPSGQMVRNRWSPSILFDLVLANHGMAVLVVDNRGSGNRGKEFSSAILLHMGEVELKDQLTALDQVLARYPQLDLSRVGFWGWSYGGFMTLYALTHSDRFIAGAAGSPVSDWRLYDAAYTERYMGLLPDNRDGYDRYSPLLHAKDLKGHLLMTHGLSDVNVHPQNTIKMADALVRAGLSFDMMTYPRQTHHFADEALIHVFQKFVDHFVTYLRPMSDGAQSSETAR